MVDRSIADMLEERRRQSYLLRTGRRAFRAGGVIPSTSWRAHQAGDSVASQSLDDGEMERWE